MVQFEVEGELALKVTTRGNSVIYTKTGAFIGGENKGPVNYTFDKCLFGPEGNNMRALGQQLLRRFTGENLPLMKVESRGDNVLYYANKAQHVIVMELERGQTIYIESENILAFTGDCKYDVAIMARGVVSQKGLVTSTLTGVGPEAYVAFLSDGNPLVFDNTDEPNKTITVDPDAVICWLGTGNIEPQIRMNVTWKNFIGQSSGESYMYEWSNVPVAVIVQPNERGMSGVDVSMDGRTAGQQPSRQQVRIY